MREQKIKSKFLLLVAAFGLLTSSAFAQCGGQDTQKVSKYKTPQMITFLEETINYLKSIDNPNKRHLLKLSKCQSIFSTGNKLVRGGEIIALRTCRSLLRKGNYNLAIINPEVKEENSITQNERLNKISLKKSTNNKKVNIKTQDFVETVPNQSLDKDNQLQFF